VAAVDEPEDRRRSTDGDSPWSSARSGSTESFHWSGRRWKGPIGALVLCSSFLAYSIVAAPPTDPRLHAGYIIAGWVALLSTPILVLASIQGVRRKTYEADDLGVRVGGKPRAFEVRWDELERIEIARLPNPPLVGMGRVDRFIFYGFRTREGTLAGTIAPKAELGPERGATLESAVSRLASLHRIALVQVSSQEFRTWRRQIRPAGR
jgi:hypothetical protein